MLLRSWAESLAVRETTKFATIGGQLKCPGLKVDLDNQTAQKGAGLAQLQKTPWIFHGASVTCAQLVAVPLVLGL